MKNAAESTNSSRRSSGRQGQRPWIAVLIVLVGITSSALEKPDRQATVTIEETLLRDGVGPARIDAGLVAAWNELAYEIAFAEDQFLTFKGHRAFSMMHLAIHDALNSIVPVYRRYSYFGERTAAHPIAAAAQAAHDVLHAQYPGEWARLSAARAAWLDQVPDAAPKKRGLELGQATAAAILALRAGDGWDLPGTYDFRSEPGQYQTTPPWDGFVAQPGFRFARPFALAFQGQFRPPPPPPLESAAYARAFHEVKESGALESSVRTDDQTAYAVWWMEFAEGSVNRLGRQLVSERGLHLWTAARLFAHLNMALFDGYVATWDSKYEHNHWRPYTAIREADTDHNDRTTADPGWESLRPAPPFPEYSSAHATGCAASMGVLKHTFGDEVAFRMTTTTAPPGMPTRFFATFTAAARECADSRVRLGWHFRYATNAGLTLGRRVARHVVHSSLRIEDGWEAIHDSRPGRQRATGRGLQ